MTSGEPVTVEIAQGRLQGRRDDGITAFKGIPYAGAPTGAHRFARPAPPASWPGVRDATAFGPTAPRTGYPPPFDQIFYDPEIPGQDCLTVNVWTPEPAAGDLPVLVWIHGGAFRNGTSAAPLYDGTAFARDGLVFVSLNYRLGMDGFLLIDGTPANRGLLDQIAAVEWVQANIARFGGDPANVTVCGESAGAMSVCALLSAPRARGLFARAIAQSGGGHHALARADARRVTAALAERLGVENTSAGLAAADPVRLAQAQAQLSVEVTLNPDPARWGRLALDLMPFEPTIDGELLPVLPIDGIAAGAGAEIPVLTGTTAEEWRLFTVPPGIIDYITEPHVAAALSAYGDTAGTLAGVYAGPGTPGDRLCEIVTDWYLRVPAIRLAEARAAGPAPTFLYELAWRSPQFGGRLGACHALELPFVFDTVATDSGRALAGEAPPASLVESMHAAWVAFTRTGDPGWAPYKGSSREVMVFDESPRVVADPHGERRTAWAGLR